MKKYSHFQEQDNPLSHLTQASVAHWPQLRAHAAQQSTLLNAVVSNNQQMLDALASTAANDDEASAAMLVAFLQHKTEMLPKLMPHASRSSRAAVFTALRSASFANNDEVFAQVLRFMDQHKISMFAPSHIEELYTILANWTAHNRLDQVVALLRPYTTPPKGNSPKKTLNTHFLSWWLPISVYTGATEVYDYYEEYISNHHPQEKGVLPTHLMHMMLRGQGIYAKAQSQMVLPHHSDFLRRLAADAQPKYTQSMIPLSERAHISPQHVATLLEHMSPTDVLLFDKRWEELFQKNISADFPDLLSVWARKEHRSVPDLCWFVFCP